MQFEFDPDAVVVFQDERNGRCNILVKQLLVDHADALYRPFNPGLYPFHVTDDNDDMRLEPVEVIMSARVDDYQISDLALYKDASGSLCFGASTGYGAKMAMQRICSFVDRGNAPNCSLAIFDKTAVAAGGLESLVCTDNDGKRPLVYDRSTEQFVLSDDILDELVRAMKVNNKLGSKLERENYPALYGLLASVDVQSIINSLRSDLYDPNADTRRIHDVGAALYNLMSSGVNHVVETGHEDGLVIRAAVGDEHLVVDAMTRFDDPTDSRSGVMKMYPGEDDGQLIVELGEWASLFGLKEGEKDYAAKLRGVLHALAQTFGIPYELSAESEVDIVGWSDAIRSIASEDELQCFLEQNELAHVRVLMQTADAIKLGEHLLKRARFYGKGLTTRVSDDKTIEQTGSVDPSDIGAFFDGIYARGVVFGYKDVLDSPLGYFKKFEGISVIRNAVLYGCSGAGIGPGTTTFGHKYPEFSPLYGRKAQRGTNEKAFEGTTVVNPGRFRSIIRASGVFFTPDSKGFVYQPRVRARGYVYSHDLWPEPVVVRPDSSPSHQLSGIGSLRRRNEVERARDQFVDAARRTEDMGFNFGDLAVGSLQLVYRLTPSHIKDALRKL